MASQSCEHGHNAEQTGEVYLKKRVSLIGGVAMIIGGVIGSGIFISPTDVLFFTGSVGLSLIVWPACGLIIMMASLCYVELGLCIKKSGGTYTYIKEVLGPLLAFLQAFSSLVLLRPVSTAILSLTFANYAILLFFDDGCGQPPEYLRQLLAITAIFLVAGINGFSVLLGIRLQVLFLLCKVSALGLVVIGGIVMLAQGETEHLASGFKNTETDPGQIAFGIYSGMWAYSGWMGLNDALEETQEPERNLPLAIFISIPFITIIYLLCNISYFTVLSTHDVLTSPAVAVGWARIVIPGADWLIPVFVAISVLGALLVTGFADSRVVDRFAREKQIFSLLGMVQVKRYTPLPGIIFLAVVGTIGVLVGSIRGLVRFFSFLEWFWIFCSSIAVIVLRIKGKDMDRPFKVPLVVPLVLSLVALFLVVTPLAIDPKIENFYALLGMLSGLIIYIPFVHFKLRVPGIGLALLEAAEVLLINIHSFSITLLESFFIVTILNCHHNTATAELEERGIINTVQVQPP